MAKKPLAEENQVKVTLGEKLFASLPKVSKALLDPATSLQDDSTESLGLEALHAKLPGASRSQLVAVESPETTIKNIEEAVKSRWCLCEQPDGDFPVIRVFKDPLALANRIGSLEGQDISVWALYGVPLRVTKPDADWDVRYLFLPGEKNAIRIPKHKAENALLVELSPDSNTDWQDDGWLGDPSLTQPVSADFYTHKKPVKSKKKSKGKASQSSDDDDIDDPDDESADFETS